MDIGELLKELENAVSKDSVAAKMAHDSVDQLSSLLDGAPSNDPLQNVTKVIEAHEDIQAYCKALFHACEHIEGESQLTRLQWLTRRLNRQHWRTYQAKKEAMLTAVTYLVMIRVKNDFLEKYELGGKK